MTPEERASRVLRENCKHNQSGNVRGYCVYCVASEFRAALAEQRETDAKAWEANYGGDKYGVARWLRDIRA